MSRFEWMVALRYLRAKRKQTVISVITGISVLGIAAGVLALTVALAINNGFQTALQSSLLSATAHVTLLERNGEFGIEHREALLPRLRRLRHVTAVEPVLYGQIAIKGPLVGRGAVLKGVSVGPDQPPPPILRRLRQGAASGLSGRGDTPGIILGARLAQETGLVLHSPATVISYQGKLTPFGAVPSAFRFRVEGIFESGLSELDSSWAFVSLSSAQHVFDLQDVVNAIELRLNDIFAAPEVAREAENIAGPKLIATTWMEQNRSLLNALRLERYVSLITVGLIECVAALNILVVLVMLVLEKSRDIALLLSMGARREQILRIFILQGLIIGGLGCALGLVGGYGICALFEHYRWLRLDEDVYAVSYVPFQSRWRDGIWVSVVALAVSLLASWQPARSAARIAPAEALRYE